MDLTELLAGGRQELRRGTVVLACLLLLRRPGYARALAGRATSGLLEANPLSLLRRLESQGVLTSEWNTEESRPRKFYRTSADGDRLAAELLEDWKRLDASIRALAQGEDS